MKHNYFFVLFLSLFSAQAFGETGLAIAYEYIAPAGVVPEGGCRLRLESGGETVMANLPADKKMAIVELKAGTWKAKRLGCGVGKVWTLDGISETGLQVQEGSIAFAGSWILDLPKIRLVKHKGEGPEETSSKVRFHPRGISLKALREWNPGQNIINAFNGRRIDMSTDEISGDGGFKLEATGLKEPENRLATLGAQLTNCADRESNADPLRAGVIE